MATKVVQITAKLDPEQSAKSKNHDFLILVTAQARDTTSKEDPPGKTGTSSPVEGQSCKAADCERRAA